MKPHLAKVQLIFTAEEATRQTWLQLAEAGYDLGNRVHIGIAAAKMKCTPDEARRNLGRAYHIIGTPGQRRERAADDGAPQSMRPSWLQLAADRTPPEEAGKIMGSSRRTAARRLAGAQRQLDKSAERFGGALKIACEATRAALRTVAAPEQGHTKAATENTAYRAKQRGVGTIARHAKLGPGMEAISDDERSVMAHLTYIDTTPRNPLQRHIDEAAAAGIC